MALDIADFPLSLAIRQVIDHVSYSNAVPDWVSPLMIDYNGREQVIRTLLTRYHAGHPPDAAFEISAPKRTGGGNIWIVPTINDQIVLHACVAAIAPTIEQRCIDQNTFSSRLNKLPNSLAFIEDQIDAWKSFKAEIEATCQQKQCILQLDIRSAYASIDLDDFSRFLKEKANNHPAATIISNTLRSYSKNRGLPFINDSVFFLGNAYFSRVDGIVRDQGFHFIRFADDYKIFADSTDRLDRLLAVLRPELRKVGFTINDDKLRLGTDEEFLEAMASQQYSQALQSADYNSGSDDNAQPASPTKAEALFKLVMACLERPDQLLHQGYGRLLTASIRRLRNNGDYVRERGNVMDELPDEEFDDLILASPEALNLAANLLETYSANGDTWRLIWVLHLCKNLFPVKGRYFPPAEEANDGATAARGRLTTIMDSLSSSTTAPDVIRAWAARPIKTGNDAGTLRLIERMHGAQYEEGGRLWHAL
ncbi:MAG: RNA-directed DNA polymerase [Azospirillaceae bacterium]|nr:RNA-directed DNA polymerase [Azospirillaceae bacterium]